MGDVNSRCETDYDCKARNFCWRKKDDPKDTSTDKFSPKICLEKHVAPDSSKFWWDIENYPEFNSKEAIYQHGKYCQSGLAYHREDTEGVHIAECVSINAIKVVATEGVEAIPDDQAIPEQVMSRKYDYTEENGKAPMPCVPGYQTCQYLKDPKDDPENPDKVYFTQNCECSLNPAGMTNGYCPIPSLYHVQKNNYWLNLMNLGDTCHTYDRDNI